MAKLYFRYGTVGSAKTLNLLAVAHNYRQQGKKVLLIRPALDVRFGKDTIKSRAGLEMKADILVTKDTDLFLEDLEGVECLLLDEAQFVTRGIIDQLRRITHELKIPVICYGLRADFRSNLFEGSLRLMELADSIEEIKATCHYCNKKSIMNLRKIDGVAMTDGPTVLLGADEAYFPCCYGCWTEQIQEAKKEEPALV